jgi:hypothetical protein
LLELLSTLLIVALNGPLEHWAFPLFWDNTHDMQPCYNTLSTVNNPHPATHIMNRHLGPSHAFRKSPAGSRLLQQDCFDGLAKVVLTQHDE